MIPADVTLVGTAADINGALNGLEYIPTSDTSYSDVVSVSVNDPITLDYGTGTAYASVDVQVGPSVSVPDVQQGLSSADLVFSNNTGNPITVGDSGDSGTMLTVGLSVSEGTLTLAKPQRHRVHRQHQQRSRHFGFHGRRRRHQFRPRWPDLYARHHYRQPRCVSITVNDPTTTGLSDVGEATASVPIVVGGPVALMPGTQSTNSSIPEVFLVGIGEWNYGS